MSILKERLRPLASLSGRMVAAFGIVVGGFLPVVLPEQYGIYLSVAILAIGLIYLYGWEWERIHGSNVAAIVWPRRLILLGMLLAIAGGVSVVVGGLLIRFFDLSLTAYSTIMFAAAAAYLPGIVMVAGGFLIGGRRLPARS